MVKNQPASAEVAGDAILIPGLGRSPGEGKGYPLQYSGMENFMECADGDCSHEIKRRLLLGRRVMSNLDSTFKSRDLTLPTKVRLVKAMVFPMVMYGCESWTVKKAEG